MINKEQTETTEGFLTHFENDWKIKIFLVIFTLPDTAPPGGLHPVKWI